MGAPNAGAVGKNCVLRPVEKSPAQDAENLCPPGTWSASTTVRWQKEYAVSSTTLVTVEVC